MKWLLKISYSWGDEEPYQEFNSFKEAWDTAKKDACNEAEIASIEVLDNQRKQIRSKYLWKEVLSQWRIHPKNFVFSKKPSHWGGFFEQKKS